MRLREVRKARGISQLKLALDLNTNQNTISRYETGAREADYKTLLIFADYFNVSIDYLLGRTDIKEVNRSVDTDIRLVADKQVSGKAIIDYEDIT